MRHAARRRGRRVAALAALVLAVAACGDDGDDTTAPTTTTRPAVSSSTTEPAPAPTEISAYFLRDEKLGPVLRAGDGDDAAAAAVEQLLAGPDDAEAELGFGTAIPAGTVLRGVEVEGGVATVDLSEEFGSGGGSASMMGRVAQVVFTLTQLPTIEAVSFEIDGAPVEALGGEGLILDEPQTRAAWEALAPAILVESPRPFEEVTSPLHVTGTANTFEATFVLEITDGEGLIVYDEPVMATSGTGTRGTFEVTATFEVPREGVGAVIVFEESAQDGGRINLVEIPVTIAR